MASESPRRRTNSQAIANEITQLIHDRVFSPGDRLREIDLAERFGVSRGPVREALRILEAKSLVRIEPMRGATVARLSDTEAAEAVHISAVLFGLAARKAAGRTAPETLAKLRQHLCKLDDLADQSAAAREFFKETLRAGRLIISVASSEHLMSLIADVRIGAPDLYGPIGYADASTRRNSYTKWVRMVDAIEAGDGDVAERMAREIHTVVLEAALAVVG